MKVGIAIQNDYPADNEVRPRKIAKSLTDRGHESVIFARKGGRRDERTVSYTHVRRFSAPWAGPFARLITASIPVNIFWIFWFVYVFYQEQLDVVVGSNIRAGLPALIAGKILGLPTVLDLQENNPEVVKLRPQNSVVHFITRNPTIVRAIERTCIQLADEVWIVVDERRDAVHSMGASQDSIRVVSNTPLLSEVELGSDEPLDGETNFQWPGFTLVYVGALSEFRGLDLIIEALTCLDLEGEDVTLAIAGDGPHLSALKQKVRRLGIEDSVFFVGWISPDDIPTFLAAGDLGVIPHHVTGFTDTTIPNKLFDYMVKGLPVLSTDMDPVHRIIEESECGRVLPPKATPEKTAQVIEEMYCDDLKSIGVKGMDTVLETYNWTAEMEVVMDSFQTITENGKQSKVEIDRKEQ